MSSLYIALLQNPRTPNKRLPPILIPRPKSGSNIKPILHHLIKILKVIESLRLKKKVYPGVLNLDYAQSGWHDRINSSFFSNKQKLLRTKNARRSHRPYVYSVFPQSWGKINWNPRWTQHLCTLSNNGQMFYWSWHLRRKA